MILSDDDIQWLRDELPGLVYDPAGQRIVGSLGFGAVYDNEKNKLDITFPEADSLDRLDGFLYDKFGVEILLDDGSITANGWPKVRETGGRYAAIARVFGVDTIDLHIDCDGGCCLGIRYSRENNFRIEKFLCELVIPFFYRLSYTQRFGIQAARKKLWGEYSHGDRGLIEHREEILGLATGSHGRNIICPCGSGKKYKYCCLAEVEAVRRIGYIDYDSRRGSVACTAISYASDRTTAIW